MSRLDDDLEVARSVFVGHRTGCKQCQKFDFVHTGWLANLCYEGTLKYKALISAEHAYMVDANAKERRSKGRNLRDYYNRPLA